MVRKGKKEDLPQVLGLIQELADYENASDSVLNTVEMMQEDGFGPKPVFDFFVADQNSSILGAAIYYYRYSTWKGRWLYLEDLVVTESQRGKGIGKLLFEECVEKAKLEKCTGMSWQVLDWNDPAINFYKKYPTTFDGEWLNCAFYKEDLDKI